jgi:D-amino-acid oxidase
MSPNRQAIVVGAGVSGLTSAVRLLEAGFDVRIIARQRTPHTTSDVAAAVWYPFRCGPRDRSLDWSRRSFREFRALASNPRTGVTMVPGIELHEQDAGHDPWWRGAVDDVRPADPRELPPAFAAGHVFTAPVIAMPAYLGWLESRVAALAGSIETRSVSRLDELFPEAGVVVNCTGLDARHLVEDGDLHPIRGQIVRVAPGHVDRFLQVGGPQSPVTYVIPRPDCTVLGGTADEGVFDMNVDADTAEAIVARCVALAPDLAKAPILSHAVGLRPGRSEVRLTTENHPGGVLVHNYGHGGGGVTLSWGCADEVARRAGEAVARR